MTLGRVLRRVLVAATVAVAFSALASVGIASLKPGYIIEWTKWNKMSEASPTLTIHPSLEARILAAGSGVFSILGLHSIDQANAERYWREAIASADTSHHRRPFTLSMHQQFNCHYYLASKNLLQDTWNIDLKRMPESMPWQVIHLCNNPALVGGKSSVSW